MNLFIAKRSLDTVIDKGRAHLYKPIQIAEILHRDRTIGDIDLEDLETYRTASRKWRNSVSLELVGRISTSSARYQDDLFNDNATPPPVLAILGEANRGHDGAIEAYIYDAIGRVHAQMARGLAVLSKSDKTHFDVKNLLNFLDVIPDWRGVLIKFLRLLFTGCFLHFSKHLMFKLV